MPTDVQVVEAAFSMGQLDDWWFARITWKCPVDGRRNCELIKREGRIVDAIPITMKCKFGHECQVVPYHYEEMRPKWSK